MKRLVTVDDLPVRVGCLDMILGWSISAICTAALMLLLKAWHMWPFE